MARKMAKRRGIPKRAQLGSTAPANKFTKEEKRDIGFAREIRSAGLTPVHGSSGIGSGYITFSKGRLSGKLDTMMGKPGSGTHQVTMTLTMKSQYPIVGKAASLKAAAGKIEKYADKWGIEIPASVRKLSGTWSPKGKSRAEMIKMHRDMRAKTRTKRKQKPAEKMQQITSGVGKSVAEHLSMHPAADPQMVKSMFRSKKSAKKGSGGTGRVKAHRRGKTVVKSHSRKKRR